MLVALDSLAVVRAVVVVEAEAEEVEVRVLEAASGVVPEAEQVDDVVRTQTLDRL